MATIKYKMCDETFSIQENSVDVCNNGESRRTISESNSSASAKSPVNVPLKRAFFAIDDGNWDEAARFCDAALELDPESGDAYLAKLMIKLRLKNRSDLGVVLEPLHKIESYQKAYAFGGKELRNELDNYATSFQRRWTADIFKTLEDERWDDAKTLTRKALMRTPENGEYYLALLMAELQVQKREDLAKQKFPFDDRENYRTAVQFGNESLTMELKSYLRSVQDNLLPNAFNSLREGKWEAANAFCNKALEQTPENGEIYLAKLMAELHVQKREDLAKQKFPFGDRENYQNAVRFGNESLTTELKDCHRSVQGNLLLNAFNSLRKGEWNVANALCEEALGIDPENGEIYLAKLMAELHVQKREDLAKQKFPFDDRKNYQNAVQFGNESLRKELEGYLCHIQKSKLPRAFDALQEGEWDVANSLCEEVLGIDPENGEAHLVKLMIELRLKDRSDLAAVSESFENIGHFKRARQFGGKALRKELNGYLRQRAFNIFARKMGGVGASILRIALYPIIVVFRMLKVVLNALIDTADKWLPIVGIVLLVILGVIVVVTLIKINTEVTRGILKVLTMGGVLWSQSLQKQR